MTRVINDPAVVARYINDAGVIAAVRTTARIDSEVLRRDSDRRASRNYDTVTIPMMGTGATDMAQVRAKGTECYGIGPAADVEDGPKGLRRAQRPGAHPREPSCTASSASRTTS